MPGYSRTVGPLHFEDLEPHRFEDLVRQLAYGFRTWQSLEAIGRTGSDDGADIRAVEQVASPERAELSDHEDGDADPQPAEERTWFIQCKREKSIAPKKAARIAKDAIPGEPPFGLVLAAACDFSLRSRTAFRDEALKLGVTEIHLWGKAELEDMLFAPDNDHLLFAYFGLSIRARRRSLKTVVSSRLTTKKRLVKALGPLANPSAYAVMLRDAAAADYPWPTDPAAFQRSPRWRYFHPTAHLRPDHLALIVEEELAFVDPNTGQWDAIPDSATAFPSQPQLTGGPDVKRLHTPAHENMRRYWTTTLPEWERAYHRKIGFVHYDRILLVDEIGDATHEPPHILLECQRPDELFDGFTWIVQSAGHGGVLMQAEGSSRVQHFPVPIPTVSDDEYYKSLGYDPRKDS